jgi:putative flippase GtrA
VKPLFQRETKFILVGIANTLFNWLVFVGLQFLLGRNFYILSLILMYVLGSIVGFYLYRTFVFKAQGNVFRSFYRFQLISIPPFLLNVLYLPLVVIFLGISPVIGQTIFMILNAIWSYLGHRFFSFRKSP